MKLTEQQVRTFREDGVLVAEDVVTDADLLAGDSRVRGLD